MKIIPAIDIIGGKCVRLTQGNYGQCKIYSASGAFSIAAWSSTSLIIRLIQRINSLRWMLRQVHNTPDITSMPVIFRIPVSKLC